MRIVLVGYMGCGKTLLGSKVSKVTGMEFLDLDTIIEEQEEDSVSNIFNLHGEDKFRQIEHQVLKDTLLKDNIIVATGGGTPCFLNNMQLIKETGKVFYLKLGAKALFGRLVNSKQQRPLISDLSDEELKTYIEKTILERERYYLAADFILDAELDSERLAEELIKTLS